MNSAISDIARRFSSFTLIRFVFSIGKWLLILVSFTQLNSSDFAMLVFTISVIELTKIFTDFGLEPMLYLKLKINRNIHRIWNYLINLKIYLTVFSTIIVIIAGLLTNNMGLVLASALLLTGNMTVIFQAIIQKYNLVKYLFALSLKAIIIFVLFTLITLLLTNWFHFIIILLAFELIIVVMIGNHIGLKKLKKHFYSEAPIRKVRSRIIRIIIKNSGLMYLTQLISNISARNDVLIIKPILGVVAQAHYSAAYRLTEPILQIFSNAILSILISRSGLSNTSNAISFKSIFHNYWYICVCFFGLLFSLASALTAMLIYKEIYIVDFNILIILFIALTPIRVLNQIHSFALMKFDRVKQVFFSTIILGFASLLSFVILTMIPQDFISIYLIFSIFSIAEMLNFIFQCFYVQKMLQIKVENA